MVPVSGQYGGLGTARRISAFSRRVRAIQSRVTESKSHEIRPPQAFPESGHGGGMLDSRHHKLVEQTVVGIRNLEGASQGVGIIAHA